jgi:hypothetical protein
MDGNLNIDLHLVMEIDLDYWNDKLLLYLLVDELLLNEAYDLFFLSC